MLMTQVATEHAEESRPGLLQRISEQIARFFGLGDEPERILPRPQLETVEQTDSPTEPILRIVPDEPVMMEEAASFRWRRHPQLLGQTSSDLHRDEREARHDAVRGLFAARAGALECAESHFARAAECGDIDLSAIPGFWQLDRAAMMTAVDAYERAGRIRDASALNARIRTMYRPRALTPMPENVMHMPQVPSKVSSSS